MDINSIRDQVSNLTLYDLKAGVRKVQNGDNKGQCMAVEGHHELTSSLSRHELYRDGIQGGFIETILKLDTNQKLRFEKQPTMNLGERPLP